MFRNSLLILVLSLWSVSAFANIAHHHKSYRRHHTLTTSLTGVKGQALTSHAQHTPTVVRRQHHQQHEVATVQSSEECLATAIYWESKSEPTIGRAAVGYVITNRTENRDFPKTVCGVVYQRNVDKKGVTHRQFSWSGQPLPSRVNAQQMAEARTMARSVLDHTVSNPIGAALYFNEASLARTPSRHAPYRKVLGGNAFFSPKPYDLASR